MVSCVCYSGSTGISYRDPYLSLFVIPKLPAARDYDEDFDAFKIDKQSCANPLPSDLQIWIDHLPEAMAASNILSSSSQADIKKLDLDAANKTFDADVMKIQHDVAIISIPVSVFV